MKYLVFSIKKIMIPLFLILYTTYYILNTSIFAASMESSLFNMESANVTTMSGNKSSSSYKLSDTMGQLAAGSFSSNGYVVKAGFQYLRLVSPFQFTISKTSINFGSLIPHTPVTDSTNLTVNLGSVGQYQVTAIEETKLKTLTDVPIPDTECDGGINACSISLAKTWSSSSAFGFGYNMSGQDVPRDFTSSTYYRPFPDRLKSDNPTIVMSNLSSGKKRSSTMTLKVNISPLQQTGSYQTIISFVAMPSY